MARDTIKAVVPHNQPAIDESDLAAVSGVLTSQWLAQGPQVASFEAALCQYLVDDRQDLELTGVAVSSGSAALFLALKALEVGQGAEVLVPTYACSSLLNAVHLTGARPVVVDVSTSDFNPTVEMTAKKLTPRTRVLILTHTFGFPVDAMAYRDLGVKIVEDCAQSIGARYRGEPVGLVGDVATFSFYATKMLTTGQGGMVVSADAALIEAVRDYREFDGVHNYYPRFNFQMTDFQAALGLSQLKRLGSFISARHSYAQRYRAAVRDGLGVCWQEVLDAAATPNCYRFVLKLGAQRARWEAALAARGVRCLQPIKPYELLHRYLHLSANDYPGAEEVSESALSIPIFPALREAQVTRIEQGLSELNVQMAVQEQ